jgi:hypothetical protein
MFIELILTYESPQSSVLERTCVFLHWPNFDCRESLETCKYLNVNESCDGTLTKFIQVDIYNINVLERHKSSASKEPHIFGVASKAFRLAKSRCIELKVFVHS